MPVENLEREVSSQKRAYQAPQLMCYGALRALTQGGSQTPNEDNSPGSLCEANRKTSAICGSDSAIKQNIVRVGEHSLGIGLYLFDYKPEFRDQWGHARMFGVMAQEVQSVMPEAVCVHPDGYKMVNYAMLGIDRVVH